MTTAELVSQTEEKQMVPAVPAQTDRAPLFDDREGGEMRGRWQDIQNGFVDDPRASVERADQLVAESIKRLAEIFARERSSLEAAWAKGGEASTEDLRQALRRYRSFFDRLLTV